MRPLRPRLPAYPVDVGAPLGRTTGGADPYLGDPRHQVQAHRYVLGGASAVLAGSDSVESNDRCSQTMSLPRMRIRTFAFSGVTAPARPHRGNP